MTEPQDLDIPTEAKPRPDDIVSVNARTAPTPNILGKVVFLTAVAAVLVLGMAFVLNQSVKGSKDQTTASAFDKARTPASAGRRKFDSDAPPLPGQAGQMMSSSAINCLDGQPPINVRGSDGAPLVTANGPVQVCRDGTVLMTDTSGSDVPASTSTYTSTPTYEPAPPTTPRSASVQKRIDPYAGDVFLSTKTAAPAENSVQENPIAGLLIPSSDVRNSADAVARPLGDAQMLTGRLEVPGSTKVKAARLGDRNMILPKGRTIECGLSVRLVSDLAGQASCVLTQNVYSDNGRVVLLERGSEAVGEYRATLEHGQRRLFVIWTRIKTPTGVIIDLNSPGADGLGSAGLPGHVDNHWWQRVGSAFLLSTVQDAIVYAASRNKGGDTIVFQNTQSAGRQMADRVLEQSINIRPTLYKNHGDRGLIYVARDLDFGDVYALRSR